MRGAPNLDDPLERIEVEHVLVLLWRAAAAAEATHLGVDFDLVILDVDVLTARVLQKEMVSAVVPRQPLSLACRAESQLGVAARADA